MSAYESRAEFVLTLRAALSTQDRRALKRLIIDDVVGVLPGTNAVSGGAIILDNGKASRADAEQSAVSVAQTRDPAIRTTRRIRRRRRGVLR